MNTSDELMLDFDKSLNKIEFYQRLQMLSRIFNFNVVNFNERKTRHGHHMVLTLDKKFYDEDIVFFQLFLGSDYRREAFNWLRVRSKVKQWNVLFKKKYDSKLKLISEEK